MRSLSLSLVFCLATSQAFAHGAIAVGDQDAKATDATTEIHFISSGHPDSESAKHKVLQQCEARGLKFCHVASWFDQCGAYARSGTQRNSGTGTGTSRTEASAAAEASCGKDCKTVAVQCEADQKI